MPPHASLFPLGASITLADLEDDVHPILHRLRASEPVSWLPVLDAWLITRYEYALQVMRDAKTFTVNHPGFSTMRVVGPSMLSLDGPEHARHRNPFEHSFRRKEVEVRLRAPVVHYIDQLIDDLIARGRADLQRDYASAIAVHTMLAVLGLEDVPVSAVRGWYDIIVDAVTRVTAGEPVSEQGKAAFAALRDALLLVIRGQTESSLLTAASSSATGLSEDQIASNAAVLLFGGIETTEGMIANALYFLFTNSNLLEMAKVDPTRIPSILEESLRLEPAASVVDRYAVRDVQLGDAPIRAGELVRVSLAAANRDPGIFPNPDRFDSSRPNLRFHVAFAQGPHVCLGLHLARLEAIYALERAILSLPNLRLDTSETTAAQPRGLVFRKPQALHVIWEA